jgi:hypothetical protein
MRIASDHLTPLRRRLRFGRHFKGFGPPRAAVGVYAPGTPDMLRVLQILAKQTPPAPTAFQFLFTGAHFNQPRALAGRKHAA